MLILTRQWGDDRRLKTNAVGCNFHGILEKQVNGGNAFKQIQSTEYIDNVARNVID